ncbi:MAG: methionine biosynthesis protein MetW [Gammaproteobacteria bacterium]|nr:methionine biosynthesis protein MetW [Gammaproteobacteria bacterium]
MRLDLEIIAALINPGARVLDLGCGSGELLKQLATEKGVNGYGIEKDPAQISACVRAGVNVIEHDLDRGLSRFPDSSFDMVVMTETLQAVASPSDLIDEMLRIGEQCIVTFPNFGHWRCRLQLATLGRMPVAMHLPHEWYDTPNIHLCTFHDFERLVADKRLPIIERHVCDGGYRIHRCMGPLRNLFGTIAFYRLGRSNST